VQAGKDPRNQSFFLATGWDACQGGREKGCPGYWDGSPAKRACCTLLLDMRRERTRGLPRVQKSLK